MPRWLVIIIISLSLKATAQDSLSIDQKIAVIARPYIDSIALRWAPLSYTIWQAGNTQGYVIERYVMVRNGSVVTPPEKSTLTPLSIKPLPEDNWEPLVTKDSYSAIAAQALFGDRFEVDLSKADVFTIVNKVRENEQRYSFALFCADMSPTAAKASGLWYTDRAVKKGERYLYRIRIPNHADSIMGSIFIGADDPYSLPAPQNLRVDFNDTQVSLRWDKDIINKYTAYRIERSINGQSFLPISDNPLVTLSPKEHDDTRYEYASDSIADLSATYSYRIKGITPFGETGVPSEVAGGSAKPSTADIPFITTSDNLNNTAIAVSWEFPENSTNAISGFSVERAPQAQGEFKTITKENLLENVRSYIDKNPQQVNYYRVTAHLINGELRSSLPYYAQLIDSIPPAPPTGLKGAIDEYGNVTLSWQPNQEQDIYGYRIYRANFSTEEPTQITTEPINTTNYTDRVNIKTLNEAVYYHLMAIDKNQNHSTLSVLLKIPLPDKIKPQPAVLLSVKSTETGIQLEWLPSGSSDVVRYDIYRKGQGREEWQRIKIQPSTSDSVYRYTDMYIEPGKTNAYTVVAIDDAELESDPAVPMNAVRINRSLKPSVGWKDPIIDRDKKRVLLRWQYEQSGVAVIYIYRSVNNDTPVLYRSVTNEQRTFTDLVIPGNTYQYQILVGFTDGSKSELSKPVKVSL